MPDTKFKKNKEDFICKNCNAETKGNGYTNHCPKCLWSLHVDINPGDRGSNCLGLMQPINVSKEGEKYSIIHKCQKCGMKKKNKVSDKDDFDKVIEISKKLLTDNL